MKEKIETINKGTVTSPQGFSAGAVEAAIKYKGRLDLGILFSEKAALSAAVFTENKVKAAPVVLSMRHQELGKARAVVVNSGCANACTGEKGLKNAEEMAGATAFKLGIERNQVLVASTGVIGVELPIERIKNSIQRIRLTRDGGHKLARAIMTTDTRPKEVAIWVSDDNGHYIIGGIAKGAGMIHPSMSTLLCFLATDALIDHGFLQKALKNAVDMSFNMITVDGDTSTNDMVTIIANGASGSRLINDKNGKVFQEALNYICKYLACNIAADGEGATKLIEVTVSGAKNTADARKVVRAVTGSVLVKAAMHGNDPNWGRVVAALGRSGAYFEENKLDVFLQGVQVMEKGCPVHFEKDNLSKMMKKDQVNIRINLNIAAGNATGWGCDLSQEYVTINSNYTT